MKLQSVFIALCFMLFSCSLFGQGFFGQGMLQIENKSNYQFSFYGKSLTGKAQWQNVGANTTKGLPFTQVYTISSNTLKVTLGPPPNTNFNKIKIWRRSEANGTVNMLVYEFYNGNTLVKQLPEIPSNGARKVRFIASGDPQFFKDAEERNQMAERTMEDMWRKVYENPQTYFGQIIAGDITQMAIQTEWERYKKLADVMEIYDGWGNHDIENDWTAWTLGDRDAWEDILGNIKNKWRRFPCSYASDPLAAHYSWDWRDVHFVQVNLFPGNEKGGTTNGNKSIDPRRSLDFLKNDLRNKVGNSGRPVVIISHYGFDDFSKKWWSDSQRNKFWDAIANYNVVLVISGHNHSHSSGYETWSRPKGKTNGPNSILNLIAGGACEGFHMDIEITDNKINVTRYIRNNKMWTKDWSF